MYNKDQIVNLFNQYFSSYDQEKYTNIWKEQSDKFKRFWEDRIMANTSKALNDQEVDEIIRILDKNGRGSTPDTEAIARAMIAQGAWERMFNEFKINNKLAKVINEIMAQTDWEAKAVAIDKLYEMNQGKKNYLTGRSANAINCFIVAYDPFNNLSVISMNDRRSLINYLELDPDKKLDKMTFGAQVVYSNKLILNRFREIGINSTARVISDFLYDSNEMRQLWKPEEQKEQVVNIVKSESRLSVLHKNINVITTHSEAEYVLLHLGQILGYETYSPDRNKEAFGAKLNDQVSLKEIPQFINPALMDTIANIDVIWFQDEFPVCCFEVEHTTGVTQGLLRLYQTSKLNTKLFVIAPADVLRKFDTEMNKTPFNKMRDRYIFQSYQDLISFYGSAKNYSDSKRKFFGKE